MGLVSDGRNAVATATKAPASNRGRQCAGGEGGGVVVKSGVGGAKQGKRTKEIACAQSMHESELRRMMAMPASAAWPGKDAGSLPFLSSDLASLWGWVLFLLGQGPSVNLPMSHCPTGAGVVAAGTVISPPLSLLSQAGLRAPVSVPSLCAPRVAGCLRGGVGAWASLLALGFA